MSTSATISSVLQLPEVFPEFKELVFQSHISGKTFAKKMLSDFLVPRPAEEGWFDKFAEGLAAQATINAETVLSAAVIVLAHSNADDAFTSACQIAIGLDPESWIAELNQDKPVVNIGDLRKKSVKELFAAHLERLSSRISAKSILSRSDLLFKHVPIKTHPDIVSAEDAYYKRDKLEEGDKLRQEIVHGSGLPHIPIAKAAATVEFLNEAATTAGRSVGFRFNLQIDMKYLADLFGYGGKR